MSEKNKAFYLGGVGLFYLRLSIFYLRLGFAAGLFYLRLKFGLVSLLIVANALILSTYGSLPCPEIQEPQL